MSLSRRRFTQEFKLAAVERLDQGASAAEVSRAFEVNPNLSRPAARRPTRPAGRDCLDLPPKVRQRV